MLLSGPRSFPSLPFPGPRRLGCGQLRGSARTGLRNTDPVPVPVQAGAVQRGARGRSTAGDPTRVAEALAPTPSGKGGARLKRGLGHPLPQPGPPAESRPRWKLTCAAASLRAPNLALRKLWPGPLPQPRPGGGAGARARPMRNGLPELAANPRLVLLGRVDPTETFQRDPSASPALPDTPRCSAVDLPTPPKPRWAVPPQGCGGGSCDWALANRREGRRRAANGKLEALDHVLLVDCWSPGYWVVRNGGAGCGSQVTEVEFRGEDANSHHLKKRTL